MKIHWLLFSCIFFQIISPMEQLETEPAPVPPRISKQTLVAIMITLSTLGTIADVTTMALIPSLNSFFEKPTHNFCDFNWEFLRISDSDEMNNISGVYSSFINFSPTIAGHALSLTANLILFASSLLLWRHA